MPFYAVRNGREKGVFTSWKECEEQVKGFHNPSFRKFASEQEALDFIASGTASHDTSYACGGWSGKPRGSTSVAPAVPGAQGVWYAVRHGRETGLFSTWEECQRQVSGFPGANFRKFKSHEEATAFVEGDLGSSTTDAIGNKFSHQGSMKRAAFGTAPVVVYTDGGCFKNGKKGAKAGYGVWWGANHPWNESERLMGQQTNNRAEIEAAIAAVRRADREGVNNLEIRTDSSFLIQCVTAWVKKWKKNGWTLSDGKSVKVRDPIERLDRLLEESSVNVTWTHVAGHAGIRGNEEADKLAREGSSKYYPYNQDSDDDLFSLDF